MTIGQFSQRTGLSISALRFYANREVLEPLDVDVSTGYRRYGESQIPDGILVRDLRRLDMALSDITDALQGSESDRKQLVVEHLRRLEAVVDRAHAYAQSLDMPTLGDSENGVSTHRATTAEQEPRMTTMTLQSRDLAQALDHVVPVASTDPEHPHLMSVLVEAKAGSVRLVATDRYRLAIRDLMPSTSGSDFSAVVPAATLEAWRTALADIDSGTGLTLSASASTVAVDGDDVALKASVISMEFPNYEPFLEAVGSAESIQLDRVELLTALEELNDDGSVILSVADNQVLLQRDVQTVVVAALCKPAKAQVMLDHGYLMAAARSAVGVEVVIEIVDSVQPVVLRSADDGTFTTLIMPVKPD